MSEEIRKDARDTELNPEELGGVAGGLAGQGNETWIKQAF